MKNSFKGFIACLLVLLMVIPVFAGAATEGYTLTQVDSAVKAKHTASIDVSGIRNGRTLKAAETTAETKGYEPDDIVSIIVELKDAAPAAEVYTDVKAPAAGEYRTKLLSKQKDVINEIKTALNVNFDISHNYTVLMNGFAFEGEYRLVEELNKLDGIRAFVSMEWETPKLFSSTEQVGAIEAWDIDYTGEGTAVAIIDTGIMADHPAFSTDPSGVKYTKDDIKAFIATGKLQGGASMNVDNVYYSAKIPFRWNYYTDSYDVSHNPGDGNDHGTHVAGITAGNGGEITGVAKDAQIFAMNVFSTTGGASWVTIIAALEDCTILGANAANLSLGTPCGAEEYYDESYQQIVENCVAAGVALSIAGGNDYNSAFNNAWGTTDITTQTWGGDGYNLVQNPDYGVVGSPATWPVSMGVASVNNTHVLRNYIAAADGTEFSYTENNDNPVHLINALGGKTLEYVVVPGYGDVADYEGIDVKGKVALIIRGSLDFTAKAANAEAAGAVASIVYNNVDEGTINMVAFEGGNTPNVFITKEYGDLLVNAEDKHITIGVEPHVVVYDNGGLPSAFSSWGSTTTLGLKPEISAPGGQIYSATDPNVSGDMYQSWDGTSMAAPHVTGGMAIIGQYVEESFPNITPQQRQDMVNIILMCTATPIADAGGDYASVRDQGAGLMDLAKAVRTKAYLTVEGTAGNRPKIEFGDDPEKTGVYEFKFTVHNFGTKTLNYTIQPSLLLDDIARLGFMDEEQQKPIYVYAGQSWDVAKEEDVMLGDANADGKVDMEDVVLIARHALELQKLEAPDLCDFDGNGAVDISDALKAMRISLNLIAPVSSTSEVDFDMPETVTVPAGGETNVTVVMKLKDSLKNYLNEYYTSGAFIEGYIELMPVEEDSVSLTLPYMGFYGDWNYAPIVDLGYYYEEEQWNSNNYPNTVGYRNGNSIQPLGFNPFVDTDDLEYYLADRNAISPNGDGALDNVNLMYMGLLRNAAVRYLVIDPATGEELAVIQDLDVCTKGFWDTDLRDQLGVNYGQIPANYDYTQFNKSDLIIRIETKLDNFGENVRSKNEFTFEASAGWKWDIPVHIDTEAPVVTNFKAGSNGFTFDVTDEHYVAYAAVYSTVSGQVGEVIEDTGIFEYNRNSTTHITLEEGRKDTFVIVGDYAGNIRAYYWNGSTLEEVDSSFNSKPVGNYDEGVAYCYGLNFQDNERSWVMFDTKKVDDLYNAEVEPSGLAIYAGAYDHDNSLIYALEVKPGGVNPVATMYTYEVDDEGVICNKKEIGKAKDVYHDMTYDNTRHKLYGVKGAYTVVEIDPVNLTEKKLRDFERGCITMDFGEDGLLYFVDVSGYLLSYNLDTQEEKEIGNTGVSPLTANNQFANQSGCMIRNTYYWASINGSQQLNLIRIDTSNGAFEELGQIYGGLQAVALMDSGFEGIDASALSHKVNAELVLSIAD